MRRAVVVSLGLLELTIAVLLASFAWQLPGSGEVERATDRLERVSQNAGSQVRNLEASLARARRRQPELRGLAARVQKQVDAVNKTVHRRDFSGAGLAAITESMGHVAGGLDGLSKTLAPEGLYHMSRGLGSTADYLDTRVVPAAEKGAAGLELATVGMKADAARLAALVKERPVELKAARNAAEALKRFEDGLAGMQRVVKLDSLTAMRDGIKGMETSLTTAAGQVDKFAGYTIPRVTVKGLQIVVESEDLWPEGKTIADGMRKAAKGCQSAGVEMEAVNKELPKLRQSLAESQKVMKTTREALAGAVADEEKLAPVLKRLPEALARLAEALPDVTADLARALRETARLKEVATALRQTQKALEATGRRWPGLSQELARAAKVLRGTQAQLEKALGQREEFEAAMRQTVELTAVYADAVPQLLDELDDGLARQQRSLGELGDNLDRVNEDLPRAARSVGRLLWMVRLLVALLAGLVGLHSAHRLTTGLARPKPAGAGGGPEA